jgi:tRNA pseudouridine65 synthase
MDTPASPYITMALTLLFRDRHYVAVHKPPNLLVHRSWLASREQRFLLQELRDQIGQRVYPVHRLDRATDGVMIFGLDAAAAKALAGSFEERRVEKLYWAIVRGWAPPQGRIEHPVKDRDETGAAKPALTDYRRLAEVELPVAVDRYPTSRYSWVEVRPRTGRRHQIRQHFKHIGHPLIGDTSYGKGSHNRFFRSHYGIQRLLLMARSLSFRHPYTGDMLTIQAEPDLQWRSLCEQLGWEVPEAP